MYPNFLKYLATLVVPEKKSKKLSPEISFLSKMNFIRSNRFSLFPINLMVLIVCYQNFNRNTFVQILGVIIRISII